MAYRLRPSSAHIWFHCAGYPTFAQQYPEIPQATDVIRDEGIATHWAAQQMGQGDWIPAGERAPNGIELTDELIDGAVMFVEELRSWGVPYHQEVTFPAPSIHCTECGGTPDAFAWNPAQRFLRVADLKMGYRPHDPFEHLQLVIYGSAILDYLGINGLTDQQTFVEFIIVQPRWFGRGGPIKRWRVRASDLRGIINRLHMAAREAVKPDAGLTAGEHCNDCPARIHCPAFQNLATNGLDYSTRALPNDLDAATAAVLLRTVQRNLGILRAFHDGLEAYVEHLIRGGAQVPSYDLAAGVGRDTWKAEFKGQVIEYGKLFNVDLAKPIQPITPTQAKKLIDPALISQFYERTPGAIKLQQIDTNSVRKIFEGSSNGQN